MPPLLSPDISPRVIALLLPAGSTKSVSLAATCRFPFHVVKPRGPSWHRPVGPPFLSLARPQNLLKPPKLQNPKALKIIPIPFSLFSKDQRPPSATQFDFIDSLDPVDPVDLTDPAAGQLLPGAPVDFADSVDFVDSVDSVDPVDPVELRLRLDLAAMAAEEDVGILCYANSGLAGFRGVLKQRFADFLVNEVDQEGRVVHLTSLEAPKKNEEEKGEGGGTTDRAEKMKNGENDEFDLKKIDKESILAEFEKVASKNDVELLSTFLDKLASEDGKDTEPLIFEPSDNKAYRTGLHMFFKRRFPSAATDTLDAAAGHPFRAVRARLLGKREGGGDALFKGDEGGGGGRRGRRGRGEREERGGGGDYRGKRQKREGGAYLQLHLYKENVDTQHAVGIVARLLGVQTKSFGFSGTKDKRAITVQRVTVFGQSAERVAALNSRLYNIRVGDFQYVEEPIILGQLGGNSFIVTLRGVEAENESIILAAAEGLKTGGFINYFGLQRFGARSVPTHAIGAALLRGEWEAAVDLILNPGDEDQREDAAEARKIWAESRNPEATLGKMPRQLVAECAVLEGLRRDTTNMVQALGCIPRTLRMMYVHSYQSFLWNSAASHRIKQYGSKSAVEGDLVYAEEEATESRADPMEEVLLSAGDDGADIDLRNGGRFHVKHVTKEDAEAQKYSIDDVLLPLPGGSIIYPANDVADIYRSLAAKEGIDLHSCKHSVKEYSVERLSGDYRRLLVKPQHCHWKILKYDDVTKPLVQTDLDRIISKPLKTPKEAQADAATAGIEPAPEGETEGPKNPNNGTGEHGTPSLGAYTALQIGFVLPPSSYATMAVRELTKAPSSVAFHRAMNEMGGGPSAKERGEGKAPE